MTLAYEIAAVAQLSGKFTLRSGLVANDYFDKYQFEARPELLSRVAEALVPLIPADTEVLAGLELGGIPVATALSLRTGLPVAFVRKIPKSYGTARLAEGADIEERRVLVVEDVVTTGGQIRLSAQDLRARGANIAAALTVIDRQQGGAENLAEDNLELLSLFTRSDLGEQQDG